MKNPTTNAKNSITDENIKTIEGPEFARLIGNFRKKLQHAQICRPTWQTTRQSHNAPVAFDPGLVIEQFYLKNWQQLFDDGDDFEIAASDPFFGPYQSYIDDHDGEKTHHCATIEARFCQKESRRAKTGPKDPKVLTFSYFAADELTVDEKRENSELIIQNRYGDVYYWRSKGINDLY